MLNSEDGSVADTASRTSDTVNTNTIDTVNTNTIDVTNATEAVTTDMQSDTGLSQSIPIAIPSQLQQVGGSPASPAIQEIQGSPNSARSVPLVSPDTQCITTPSSTHSTQFRLSVSTEAPCSPASPFCTDSEQPADGTTETAAAPISLSNTNGQTVETEMEGAVTIAGEGSLEEDEEVRPKPSLVAASESGTILMDIHSCGVLCV